MDVFQNSVLCITLPSAETHHHAATYAQAARPNLPSRMLTHYWVLYGRLSLLIPLSPITTMTTLHAKREVIVPKVPPNILWQDEHVKNLFLLPLTLGNTKTFSSAVYVNITEGRTSTRKRKMTWRIKGERERSQRESVRLHYSCLLVCLFSFSSYQ